MVLGAGAFERGIPSSCLRLFASGGMEYRMALSAIRRSLTAGLCPEASLPLPSRIPRKLPIAENDHNLLQTPLQRGSDSTSALTAQARHEKREVAHPLARLR